MLVLGTLDGWTLCPSGTVLLCVRLAALSFESRMFTTVHKRLVVIESTVGVSIAVAVGMPPRMSGAVITAGGGCLHLHLIACEMRPRRYFRRR